MFADPGQNRKAQTLIPHKHFWPYSIWSTEVECAEVENYYPHLLWYTPRGHAMIPEKEVFLYKKTKYRTFPISCDICSLVHFQPADAQGDSNMYALSYSTKSCAVCRFTSAFGRYI